LVNHTCGIFVVLKQVIKSFGHGTVVNKCRGLQQYLAKAQSLPHYHHTAVLLSYNKKNIFTLQLFFVSLRPTIVQLLFLSMTERPKILVVYYTQTGQLKRIIDTVIGPLQDKATIVYEEIKPVQPFTFPWDKQVFFDTMPETVLGKPRAIEPLKVDPDEHFDLVILAYQPWFLSPSQPTAAFLQNETAKRLLKGKPVITLIGCRNMWLNGQEKVKGYLQQAGASLVGNIVLVDTSPNLVALLTVLRWQFKGQKEASGWLPAAGVQEKDIIASSRFAAPIQKVLETRQWDTLHPELLELKAVELKPNLILLEQRGISAFGFWSKFISAKGGPGAPERKGRLTMYRLLLLVGIFVLTPIDKVSSIIKLTFRKTRLQEDVQYFKGIRLR
jgi:hypothetical protein